MFPLLTFRQHCRRCGRIFCDRCSSYRALLDPSDIVHDPSYPEAAPVATQQRVCQNCYEEVTAAVPSGLSASRTNSMERIFIDQRRLNIPSPTRAQSSSQLSDLAEYAQSVLDGGDFWLMLTVDVRCAISRCPTWALRMPKKDM